MKAKSRMTESDAEARVERRVSGGDESGEEEPSPKVDGKDLIEIAISGLAVCVGVDDGKRWGQDDAEPP